MENKIGIPISRVKAIYQKAAEIPGIKIKGVDVYIASQLTELVAFEQTFKIVKSLVLVLTADEQDIKGRLRKTR